MKPLRRLRKQTIVTHLLSGQSLQGVLIEEHRDCIVLRHAIHLDQKAELEGDVVIPAKSIDYYQTVRA